MESILVVAAHPDDEILGCGGTILEHSRRGDEVHILILAEGLTSRFEDRSDEDEACNLTALANCARRAAQIVGAKSIELLSLPDNKLDSLPLLDVIKPIESKIRSVNPSIIYTHQPGCLNIDHRVAHKATVTAARALPGSNIDSLLFFEGISSTEWQVPGGAAPFVPNWFVNIENSLDKKLEALRAYDSEMRDFPHPRSYDGVLHLARVRGMAAGFKAAEAFSLGRHLTSNSFELPPTDEKTTYSPQEISEMHS